MSLKKTKPLIIKYDNEIQHEQTFGTVISNSGGVVVRPLAFHL